MKAKLNKYAALLFLVLFSALVNSANTPPSPSGFTWYSAQNGVGTFLKPDGWYIHEEGNENTNALFISRENIKENGKFIIGFSVNQISSYSKNSKLKASQYAKVFIQKIIDKHEVIKSGVIKGGPTDMNVARVKSENSGVKTIVHHIAIGMDDRDELYLISFEAPESEWQAYYEKAGLMLNYIILGS